MTIALIILSVIYGIAFLFGIITACVECLNSDWHEVKSELYTIPMRKLFFTFDFGEVFAYWFFGYLMGYRTKAQIKNIHDKNDMERRIHVLEKQNDGLKKENITMATEIHLLENGDESLMDAINEE